MEDECRTKLISDAPSDADDFGSHKRIAQTLAELVRTETGGKAIGLEGGWGAGKSTVVNLLRAELTADRNLSFIVFDAWAHEGDPLKRSFLETLIEEFVRRGWVARDTWTEKRDNLTNRRRVVDTKTTPRLTTFGKCLLTTGFMAPLGLTCLSAALKDSAGLAWLVVGILLSLAPLVALLFARLSKKSADAWAILLKGTTTTSHTEAVETPDPTSVEFQAIFVDLMADALSSDARRRLVLVIDNLDRVAPGDALAIWASLRTFFLIGESHTKEWFGRFWAVVPYDRQGLGRVWTATGNDGGIAESFIGKTFQMRMNVPPVLLSNWRSFLDRCLREALPEHDAADFHSVYRLYATCALESDLTPTPRNLKLFVNDIGGLHRQWQHEIPLADIAYFVLLRQRDTDIVQGLLDDSVPSSDVRDLLSAEPEVSLAALVFNAPPTEARQILLSYPITRMLEQGDGKALSGLETSPGVWETLEAIDFAQWSEKEPLKLANAARCLCESGMTKRMECAMKTQTIAHLRSAVLKVNRWRPCGEEMGRGLSSICRLCPSPEVAQRLILTLTAREQADSTATDPGEWTTTVVTMLEALDDVRLLSSETASIPMPASGVDALAVCCRLAECDKGGRYWGAFQIDVAAGTLDQAISDAIADDVKVRKLVDAMPVLRRVGAQVNWKAVATLAHARLAVPAVLPAPSVAALLDLLVEIRSSYAAAQERIASLVTNGYLLHHMHTVCQEAAGGNADIAARCLVLQITVDASLALPPGNGNATAGHKLANTLVSAPSDEFATAVNSYLRTSRQTDALYKVAVANPALGPLVRRCLELAADSDDPGVFLAPEAVVEHWAIVKGVPGEGASVAFGKTLREKTGLVSHLMNLEFAPARGSLYALMIGAGAVGELGEHCVQGLRGIGCDLWQQELAIEDNLAELVVQLVEAGVVFRLGHEFMDALVQHAKKTAAGQAAPKYLSAANWGELLSRLADDSRRVFRRGLLDTAIAADGDLPDVFFEYYGGELAHSDVLADSRAVSGLFTSLVKRGSACGIRWMIRFLVAEPHYLSSRADPDAVGDLRSRVRELISAPPGNESDEIRAVRLEFADAIGVPRPDDSPMEGGD